MITISNLQKSFGKKQALRGVNLELTHGIFGLLGPNGAGKTTLLRTLLGLYQSDGGSICIDGEDLTNTKKLAEKTGYLPQRFGGFGTMRTGDFLEYIAALKQIKDPEAEIEEALRLTNLLERREDKIKALSGGMLRRLGIAQTVLGKPELMIFDEPTTGLDPEERIRFRNLILQLPRDRVILISAHIVDDVAMICDKVAVMRTGTCIFHAEPELLAEQALHHVFSLPQGLPIPEGGILSSGSVYTRMNRIVSKLPVEQGIEETPTLEDGYLYILHEMGDRT